MKRKANYLSFPLSHSHAQKYKHTLKHIMSPHLKNYPLVTVVFPESRLMLSINLKNKKM